MKELHCPRMESVDWVRIRSIRSVPAWMYATSLAMRGIETWVVRDADELLLLVQLDDVHRLHEIVRQKINRHRSWFPQGSLLTPAIGAAVGAACGIVITLLWDSVSYMSWPAVFSAVGAIVGTVLRPHRTAE